MNQIWPIGTEIWFSTDGRTEWTGGRTDDAKTISPTSSEEKIVGQKLAQIGELNSFWLLDSAELFLLVYTRFMKCGEPKKSPLTFIKCSYYSNHQGLHVQLPSIIHFFKWCLGSGVVLYCIDSWSLPPYLLGYKCRWRLISNFRPHIPGWIPRRGHLSYINRASFMQNIGKQCRPR